MKRRCFCRRTYLKEDSFEIESKHVLTYFESHFRYFLSFPFRFLAHFVEKMRYNSTALVAVCMWSKSNLSAVKKGQRCKNFVSRQKITSVKDFPTLSKFRKVIAVKTAYLKRNAATWFMSILRR